MLEVETQRGALMQRDPNLMLCRYVKMRRDADAPRAVVPENRIGGPESGEVGAGRNGSVELQRRSRTEKPLK